MNTASAVKSFMIRMTHIYYPSEPSHLVSNENKEIIEIMITDFFLTTIKYVCQITVFVM